jgi:hypothetical protein
MTADVDITATPVEPSIESRLGSRDERASPSALWPGGRFRADGADLSPAEDGGERWWCGLGDECFSSIRKYSEVIGVMNGADGNVADSVFPGIAVQRRSRWRTMGVVQMLMVLLSESGDSLSVTRAAANRVPLAPAWRFEATP